MKLLLYLIVNFPLLIFSQIVNTFENCPNNTKEVINSENTLDVLTTIDIELAGIVDESVIINWGDETITKVVLTKTRVKYTHDYDETGEFLVTLSNYNSVTQFYCSLNRYLCSISSLPGKLTCVCYKSIIGGDTANFPEKLSYIDNYEDYTSDTIDESDTIFSAKITIK